jgi:hypothetical protein
LTPYLKPDEDPAPGRVAAGIRVASFALGVAVILDALVIQAPVVQWVAGLILVGIVPPEAVLAHLPRRRR